MRVEVLGVERRRRWRDEEEFLIASSFGPDRETVTQVAQRNDIIRQQIYAWRHELRKKGLWSPDQGAVFSPVGIPTNGSAPSEPEPGRPFRWSFVWSMVAVFGSTARWRPRR